MDTRMMALRPGPPGGSAVRDDSVVRAETVVMEILSDPAVKAGLALLVLIIVSAFAFLLVSRLRDYTSGDWDSASDGLLNFEEMRLKGDISEEEFRTIQAATRVIGDGDAAATRSDSSSDSSRVG